MATAPVETRMIVTEADLKNYWKSGGCSAENFPRINRKHKVNLIHLANVLTKIGSEVAGLSLDARSSRWEELQLELGYNDDQMEEVHKVRDNQAIALDEFVALCCDGVIAQRRKNLTKVGKKRKEEEVLQGANEDTIVPQGKRSKVTKHRSKNPEEKKGMAKAPASDKAPPPLDDSLSGHGAEGVASLKTPQKDGGPQQEAEVRTPAVPEVETTPPAVSKEAPNPLTKRQGCTRQSPRASLFKETRADATPGSDPTTRRTTPRKTGSGPTSVGTVRDGLSPAAKSPVNEPKSPPSIRRSPRKSGRMSGEANQPMTGRSPRAKAKRIAPQSRLCPSKADPPCQVLVPSAANKCQSCHFDIKALRKRSKEEKMDDRVRAVKSRSALRKKVLDDLKVLHQMGVQVSLLMLEEGKEGKTKGEKKGANSTSGYRLHRYGLGDLGHSWVYLEKTLISFNKAAKEYAKTKKEQMRAKANFEQPEATVAAETSEGGPSAEPAASRGSFVLPDQISNLVADLKLDADFSKRLVSKLEEGQVDLESLKILVDQPNEMQSLFEEKVGPRLKFIARVKNLT